MTRRSTLCMKEVRKGLFIIEGHNTWAWVTVVTFSRGRPANASIARMRERLCEIVSMWFACADKCASPQAVGG